MPGTNRPEISADMGKLVYENNKLTFWKNAVSEREFNNTNTASFPRIENEKIEKSTYVKKSVKKADVDMNKSY